MPTLKIERVILGHKRYVLHGMTEIGNVWNERGGRAGDVVARENMLLSKCLILNGSDIYK